MIDDDDGDDDVVAAYLLVTCLPTPPLQPIIPSYPAVRRGAALENI